MNGRLASVGLACGSFVLCLAAAGPQTGKTFRVPLRTRVEAFKGSGAWEEVHLQKDIDPKKAAVIICDMWDHHWCAGAERRVGLMAPKMAPLLERARARGIVVIHAPSETMGFYKDLPQRKAMLSLTRAAPEASVEIADPPLPIDDKEGGCDTGQVAGKPYPWTRQIAAIPVAPMDYISDNGLEIYSLLQQRGIDTLFIMGVHTNMCVLNRSFAIKQMTRWGKRCILVRDLTDAMYDPAKRPFVSHDEGTEMVIQHIEKHWCPTVLSSDLLAALAK